MPDDSMRRRIVKAILSVAAIAVVIGVVIALGTTLVLRMAGLDGGDGQDTASHATEATEQPSSLPQPKLVPTKTPATESAGDASGDPTADSTDAADDGQSGEDDGDQDKKKQEKKKDKKDDKADAKGITLSAGSKSTGSMQRVTLSGSYPGGDGTVLQVQRKEGGRWVDFPTSATVDGKHFDTYVALGQPGPNKLRVVGGGKTSNVVTITVS